MLDDYTTNEIVQICKYLNKEYNIYEPDEMRWEKIKYAFYKTSDQTIQRLKKGTFSNEFINELMLKYYACERVVKYHFIKCLKDAIHDIVAFEMSIGESRIDICRINGKLCAYEIKTEYDNYDRLETQMKDYFSAFERVYIIVPIQNAYIVQDYVPSKCGIITYRLDKNYNMIFAYKRSAQENKCDISFCLNSLSSSDLTKILKLLKVKPSKTKNENLELLLNISRERNIWSEYKYFLKDKYKEQWNYLRNNFEKILPIDCQSFFASKMNPDLLYEKER
jgi:hypothetical protein